MTRVCSIEQSDVSFSSIFTSVLFHIFVWMTTTEKEQTSHGSRASIFKFKFFSKISKFFSKISKQNSEISKNEPAKKQAGSSRIRPLEQMGLGFQSYREQPSLPSNSRGRFFSESKILLIWILKILILGMNQPIFKTFGLKQESIRKIKF